MVGQILPNNNESATGIFPKKIHNLNTAIVSWKEHFEWNFLVKCSSYFSKATKFSWKTVDA
jgi:hypothetical protein